MPAYGYQLKTTELKRIGFDREDMAAIGQAALGFERDRIGRGLNAADLPTIPLTRAYRAAKVRRGGAPVRDWKLTGRALDSLRTTVDGEGQVSIGFALTGPEFASLAKWNTEREQIAGLSPSDQAKTAAVMQDRMSDKVAGRV